MKPAKVHTIAPNAPFLPVLVERILDGTLLGDWPRTGPFWLADVTIVLPTRRARLELAAEFLKHGHRLLPDIRTFGGEALDEEPFLPPHDLPILPPAATPLERRLILGRLIDAFARTPGGRELLATPPNPAEILGLAQSLGEILDDLTTAGKTLAALDAELQKPDLAGNWERSKKLLEIALDYWPKELAQRGKGDGPDLRNQRLRRQASAAEQLFGDKPVIAAGTTGSIPATADLLVALMRLPRGAVVLPGLDNTLSKVEFEALLTPESNPHGHPQYALAQLLRRLGTPPATVPDLAPVTRRSAVLRAALARPDATAGWIAARRGALGKLDAVLKDLTVIAARTEEEEARAIALAAREALAARKSVGIVTPDQSLARRIAIDLRRFGIHVDDPAGTPLFQSAAGRFARLILSLVTSEFAPVELMGLLRNKAADFGRERREVLRLAGRLEFALLRGRRLRPGLAGLRHALAENLAGKVEHAPRLFENEGAEATALFDQLDKATKPLRQVLGLPAFSASDFAKALLAAVDLLSDPKPDQSGTLSGRTEFESWAGELIALAGDGPQLDAAQIHNALFQLMADATVATVEKRRDDIFIWGLLEARLQSPDLMILAGVNEEVWPGPADPGPWLSRSMRIAVGLEPPERRQGQTAHDFEMAVGNQRAVIAFAGRRGTAPALPSRYLQRLEAFIGADWSKTLRDRGQRFVDMARRLDAAPLPPRPADRPLPSPAACLRPRKISITEVETLFRSPYDLYARHTLHLRKQPPLGEQPDARERGNMIHNVFSKFFEAGGNCTDPRAVDRLMELARAEFAGLDAIGERRDIWLRRFERAAELFLAFERGRDGSVGKRHAEIRGEWQLPMAEPFVLTGRADRIDAMADGSVAIIDFKTGSVPRAADMTNFLAPQLLLEAAMVRAGAFAGIPPNAASALTYIKIGLGPAAFVLTHFKPQSGHDLASAADEAARRMQLHIDALLLNDKLPLASSILPQPTRRYRGDYDHLARKDEWTLLEGDEDE